MGRYNSEEWGQRGGFGNFGSASRSLAPVNWRNDEINWCNTPIRAGPEAVGCAAGAGAAAGSVICICGGNIILRFYKLAGAAAGNCT